MSEVRKLGVEKAAFPKPPTTDDLAFLMYTSGTTGAPKGAMLKHSNVVAAIASVEILYPLKPTDVVISYLPLAHIFECVVESTAMCNGAAIGFYQGEVTKLTEDTGILKPTMFMGVPRVFSKIYQRIMQTVEAKNCIIRYVFHSKYNGQANLLRKKAPLNLADDKKIFAPIRERLGLSRCRLIVTGAAPCPAYVIEFLRIVCKDAQVLQGYGMTETSAAISIVTPGDSTMGHCGAPFSCCEIKLRDVPEMKYFHTDPNPTGEILCRGANIFAGYYKNDEATKETLEEDGWLATGDIGRFNPNGTLSIIDRKKNIFKLSQGEYVAAERVENVYSKSPVVGQIWVYGNSFKSFVVAAIVPSSEFIKGKAIQMEAWTGGDSKLGDEKYTAAFKELFSGKRKEQFKKLVFDELNKENSHLKGFEKVKDLIIETDINALGAAWTEQNDCMTPSFKLKRPYLLKRYLKDLKELYATNGEPAKEGEKWPGE
jgi:long-chain acyl-CoA synthetase